MSIYTLFLAALLCVFIIGYAGTSWQMTNILRNTSDKNTRTSAYAIKVALHLLFITVVPLMAALYLVPDQLQSPLPEPFADLAGALRWALGLKAPIALDYRDYLCFTAAVIAGFFAVDLASPHKTSRRPGLFGALAPRNGREVVYAAMLAVSAGAGEELLFRLLLPLLLIGAGTSAAAAFLASSLFFGACHLFRGWRSGLTAAATGLLISAAYLVLGSLRTVIVLHIIINLNALLVRPLWRHFLGNPQSDPREPHQA